MSRLAVERTVDAGIECTFAVFSDVTAAAAHLSAVTRVQLLSDGPIGEGTRWRETRRMMRREATEEMWIESYDPPHAYSVAAESAGTRYLTTFTFVPTGSGATNVEMAFEAQPRTIIAKLLSAIMAPMIAGEMRKALARDMDDLKAAAESRRATGVPDAVAMEAPNLKAPTAGAPESAAAGPATT